MDSGTTLTYSLGGTDAASFSIVSTSGQLQTRAALNYETKTSYSVTVSVADGNGGTDSIDVTINVTNVNEAPIFTDGSTTTRAVAENTASGQNIGAAVAATDVDSGTTLTYSLGGTDAASFSIVSTSGQLQTRAALDYETKASYSATVSVSDGNGGSDSIEVTINVTNVNEAPVFSDGSSTTRAVAENTASGQNIGTPVAATDPENGTLTYTLGGTDASSFSIVSTSGQLQTRAALNYETKTSYSVTVSVADGNGGSDSIDVTINVTNVNEAPIFTDGSTTTRAVAENTASGQNIGTPVAATDPENGTLTYTLGGTDAASFSIVSTSGQLQTRAALDYETKSSYTVSVSVSNGNGGSDSIEVTINVTNVNEAPIFTDGSTTTRAVAENTASGQNIGAAVAATDVDSGTTLTYSLGGTDAASFSIVSTSGQLQTRAALDYETKASYSATVSVSDGNGGSDSIEVTINVTNVNEAPVFSDGSSTTRAVAENTASGQNIGTAIAATDADNDTLTYTLGGTDASSFSIVSTSGQLQTKAALDYETKASYTVTLFVTDGNGGADSISVTINVTDVDEVANNAPVFTDGTSTTRSIAENTVANTNIGTAVAATDTDNDTLTYTLGGTDASSFSIVSTSGQLQTRAALNYETKTSYSVTVSVADGNGGTDSIDVTINVTNVNEAPIFTDGSTTTRAVAENTASGQNIGAAVAATDVDSGTTLTYSLGGTDAASFSIVSTSGQLQTRAALDYETKASYSTTVSVSDGNGGSDSITVTINVTDVSEVTIDPPLSERTQQVQDAIVAAIDGVDSADDVTAAHLAAITSLSLNNKGITSLKSGDFNGLTALTALGLSGNSISDISSLSGLTSLKTLTLGSNSISDISPLSGLTSLKTLNLSVNSISDISSLSGLTSLETLTLGSNSISNISSLSGLTSLKTLFLRGNSISDISPLSGLTSLETLTLFSNSISDISSLSGLTSLTYLSLSGNSISDISSLSGLTSLTYLSLSVNSISDISPLSGLTSLKTLFLRGNSISDISPLSGLTSLMELNLRGNPISDYGPLRRLKAANPDVDIDIDLNNNPPVFTDGDSTTRSVPENTAAGQNIGDAVAATDADTGDTLTYSLGGTDASSFRIVSTSGQLQTRAALDRETKSSYTVTVTAYDGNSGGDRITVTINVTDVVGAAPSVETSPVIPENTALFTNFPNPFNPETWIPYQLAKPAEVTIKIYAINGQVVRRLALGHQSAGMYQSRSRAAYWDGKNAFGEPVASGVYFYTLSTESTRDSVTAGDFTATRKMLIRK